MNSSRDQQIEALQVALKAVRENENRWMEISADFSTDPERMEQWSSTAKLRRLEVARIDGAFGQCGRTLWLGATGMQRDG